MIFQMRKIPKAPVIIPNSLGTNIKPFFRAIRQIIIVCVSKDHLVGGLRRFPPVANLPLNIGVFAADIVELYLTCRAEAGFFVVLYDFMAGGEGQIEAKVSYISCPGLFFPR